MKTQISKNVLYKRIIKVIFILLILFLLVTIFNLLRKTPSNTRNWLEGLSITPKVSISDGAFVIEDLRDWRYGADGQILSKNYIYIEYKIEDLERVWFIEEPFTGNKAVAHTFFIFDFKGQRPIGLSVEARREEGEEYKLLDGVLREYELFYNWATEEDLLSLRAVYLNNPMYMYPINFSEPSNRTKLLLSVLEKTNQLETKPQFYNTLTNNCTNILAKHANQVKKGTIPIGAAWFLPGYADELLYKKQLIPTNKPFKEIQKDYYITEFVKENVTQNNFSKMLREYLL